MLSEDLYHCADPEREDVRGRKQAAGSVILLEVGAVGIVRSCDEACIQAGYIVQLEGELHNHAEDCASAMHC